MGGLNPYIYQQLYDKDPALAQTYGRAFRPVNKSTAVLSVSDIERLAKAGVQIKFEDIADHVAPDPHIVGSDTFTRKNHLVHLFRERLMNRERVKQSDANDLNLHGPTMMIYMPDLWASAYKDKVYVFVATGNSEPLILEDNVNLYPSDALLAKYDLLNETLKATGDQHPPQDMGAAQATVRQQPYRHNGGKLIP